MRARPLKVLDIEPPTSAMFYGSGPVLSRPDQHVAWRSNTLPADPLVLIDRVRGASKPGWQDRARLVSFPGHRFHQGPQLRLTGRMFDLAVGPQQSQAERAVEKQ